jgi:hypothetical protein
MQYRLREVLSLAGTVLWATTTGCASTRTLRSDRVAHVICDAGLPTVSSLRISAKDDFGPVEGAYAYVDGRPDWKRIVITNRDGWLLLEVPGPGLYDLHIGGGSARLTVVRAVPVQADCRTDVAVDLPNFHVTEGCEGSKGGPCL